MQWFIRTTDELKDRIEAMYQLDGALQQLAKLKTTVETMSDRIEKDLRPTKVQHEMRLRELEPLLEQIDEHTLRLTKLEEATAELTPLAGDLTSAYGILRKNKGELEELRAELKNLRSTKSDQDDLKQIRAELTILKRMKSELDGLKGLSKELDELREKIPEPESEPKLSLEEFAEDLQSKLGKVFIAMQSDTNKELESLKKTLAAQPTLPQLIKALRPKFEEPKAEIEKIYQLIAQVNIGQSTQNSDFKEQKQKFISQMEAKDEELKQLWQLFSDRIEKKEDEIKQLRAQSDDFKAELKLKDTAIHELQRHVEILSRRLAELESRPRAVKVEKPIEPPVEPKPVEPTPVEPKPVEKPKSAEKKAGAPKIMHFELSARSGIYFSGTAEQIKAKLESALNVDELKHFLESSKSANNVIFMRSLERHVKNLQKLESGFDTADAVGNNTSWEITKKYFDLFKQLLESVTTICYRGLLRQPTYYQKFLEHFNRYLSRCGLYTRIVLPNAQLDARDLADMKISYRETKDPSKKNRIADVERLPYYIDYAAIDGSTKSLFFEGKMMVYNA